MRLLIIILKILCPCLRHIHSKETTENATRELKNLSFLKNINAPCRVCLHIAQSYVYARKLPSEVKMFSH